MEKPLAIKTYVENANLNELFQPNEEDKAIT